METWEALFSSVEKPVTFNFHEVQITCGQEVAFATAIEEVCQHRSERQAGAAGISTDYGFAQDCRPVARHA
jgi:ketosteroid isomerase-like protein